MTNQWSKSSSRQCMNHINRHQIGNRRACLHFHVRHCLNKWHVLTCGDVSFPVVKSMIPPLGWCVRQVCFGLETATPRAFRRMHGGNCWRKRILLRRVLDNLRKPFRTIRVNSSIIYLNDYGTVQYSEYDVNFPQTRLCSPPRGLRWDLQHRVAAQKRKINHISLDRNKNILS